MNFSPGKYSISQASSASAEKVNTALNSKYVEAKTLTDFLQEQNLAQIHETFQKKP